MARGSDLSEFATYAVVGGGLYLGYKMALDGQLGADWEKFANDIYKALFGKPFVPGAPPGHDFAPDYAAWKSFAQSYGIDPCDFGAFSNWQIGRNKPVPSSRPSWFCT